jgi:hypothetical protein
MNQNGVCLSCGERIFPLDPETGYCLICDDTFEADFQFYKEDDEPHFFVGQLDFGTRLIEGRRIET